TCGSLVYSAGYRHPAVLANAMATLDQVARGRTVLGLGGGWLKGEYDAYGLHYGTPGERLRMLEEYVQCVRGLLTREHTTFDGDFFHMRDAQCEPKSVNVGMAFTEQDLRRQFGPIADAVRPGVLSGSVPEMVGKVGAYVDAGASYVILAMRAPFDRDGLERFAAEVVPAVRG